MNKNDLSLLRWAEYGSKLFSTCGRRQYMAIVTGSNGRILGTGYNGSPPGIPHCVDGACPRLNSDTAHGAPYGNCIAVHAEANAIMWSDRTGREGGTVYVNGTPCWDCGKMIAGSGIKRVVYIEDPDYADWPKVQGLLAEAGVQTVGVEREDL